VVGYDTAIRLIDVSEQCQRWVGVGIRAWRWNSGMVAEGAAAAPHGQRCGVVLCKWAVVCSQSAPGDCPKRMEEVLLGIGGQGCTFLVASRLVGSDLG